MIFVSDQFSADFQVSKSCSEVFQFFRVLNEAAAHPVLTLADEVFGWKEGECGVMGYD